jgi:hypothetical protein
MKRLLWLCASGFSVAALALACGGGGTSAGASQINGTLNKASGMQIVLRDDIRSLLARVGSWLAPSSAVAQATTNCGHLEGAAKHVQVSLRMNGSVVQTTTTNGDGHFTFSDLAPGDYVIQVKLSSGTILVPVIVQPGQTTNLTGELDADCHDVNGDGNIAEIALHVDEATDDGSTMTADETENGGEFHGDVHDSNGKMKKETGHRGDRGDETDSES